MMWHDIKPMALLLDINVLSDMTVAVFVAPFLGKNVAVILALLLARTSSLCGNTFSQENSGLSGTTLATF